MVSAQGSTICIDGTSIGVFKVNVAEAAITMVVIMFDGALAIRKMRRHFKQSLVVS